MNLQLGSKGFPLESCQWWIEVPQNTVCVYYVYNIYIIFCTCCSECELWKSFLSYRIFQASLSIEHRHTSAFHCNTAVWKIVETKNKRRTSVSSFKDKISNLWIYHDLMPFCWLTVCAWYAEEAAGVLGPSHRRRRPRRRQPRYAWMQTGNSNTFVTYLNRKQSSKGCWKMTMWFLKDPSRDVI